MNQKRRMTCLTIVLAVVASAIAPGAQSELQGVWSAETLERDGRAFPLDARTAIRFEFAGNTLTASGLSGPGSKHSSAFTVDGRATPKRLDISSLDGKRFLGAYEFRSGVLALALVDAEKGSWPSKVEAPRDTPITLLLMKKAAAAR